MEELYDDLMVPEDSMDNEENINMNTEIEEEEINIDDIHMIEESPIIQEVNNNDEQIKTNDAQHQQETSSIIKSEVENNNQNVYIINKEDFNNFIKSLNILKNFTTIVNIENGISSFISDSKIFFIQFNCNSPKISLLIPDPEKQVSQLSFLSKSDVVYIKDEGNIYRFYNNQNIKFAVRKGIYDESSMLDKKKYDNLFNLISNMESNSKLILSYDFKDKSKIDLDTFLSISKTVKSPHIRLYSEKNNDNTNDIIMSIGELKGSGEFELLRFNNIDLNWMSDAAQSMSDTVIDALIDKNIFNYDYSSLKISIYCKDPDKTNDINEKGNFVESIFVLVEMVFLENNYKMRVIQKTSRNIRG